MCAVDGQASGSVLLIIIGFLLELSKSAVSKQRSISSVLHLQCPSMPFHKDVELQHCTVLTTPCQEEKLVVKEESLYLFVYLLTVNNQKV